MKIINKTSILFFVLMILQFPLFAQDEECTIGVASGSATTDGRPIIWKTRDYSSAPNNELVYNTSYDLNFLEIVSAGKTYAWMGVNENGFAILNSLTVDLTKGSTGFSNGSLMREALGTCLTIGEFQNFLDETNSTGRQTRGNFAVLDKTGEAALYEIDGTSYWKYSTDDTTHAPHGYILRTNFALNGDGSSGGGYERYDRTSDLIESFYEGDSLNYKSIIRYQMRDFSDYSSNAVPVPFDDTWISGRPHGYIYTDKSICRASSVSATVIQGVLENESEKLSTMWTMLGQPATAITVPYWPVGATPPVANGSSTAPLCDIALQIKATLFDYSENSNYIDSYKLLDGEGNGLWTDTFPVEDSIFVKGEELLNNWRSNGFTTGEMITAEGDLANYAYESLQQAYTNLITDVDDNFNGVVNSYQLSQNYPNPFNPSTRIDFAIPKSGHVVLKIFDLLGRVVATIVNNKMEQGTHSVMWNTASENIPSGIYFYKFCVSGENRFSEAKKMILMK
ncbi:MAG: T9SS type A sorting domain-containing protein [Ignavibacteriae bacterium]|nr:T9SS type A sorting domain-containing protein [Ignavibacteriota bacterium]